MLGAEAMCTHIYCMLEPWEFIYYTRGRRENIRESCRIYQSINCINNAFLNKQPIERSNDLYWFEGNLLQVHLAIIHYRDLGG